MADTEVFTDLGRSTATDQRAFERLPPQFESIEVRTKGGSSIIARVQNVSLGGIGLRLDSPSGLAADDEVELIYRYVVMPAVVRYVEAYADGVTIAGLQWMNR